MRLQLSPAAERADLVADPVAAALSHVDGAEVAEIDPDLADTAALAAAYEDVTLAESANCVVVLGRRGGQERLAACLVLATTRVDVNGTVRRHLDVRKISFAPMDRAVAETGMEYGGITPVGLPAGWQLLIDPAVVAAPRIIIGSGLRRSKLVLPGAAVLGLPGAQVLDGLGR